MQVFHGKEYSKIDTSWERKDTLETMDRILQGKGKSVLGNVEAK